jgi:glyoxylase I family protein
LLPVVGDCCRYFFTGHPGPLSLKSNQIKPNQTKSNQIKPKKIKEPVAHRPPNFLDNALPEPDFSAMKITRLHHVAIIGSDYRRSKHFYTEVLGFSVLAETFRAERNSYKLDLALPGGGQIELFSFPNPPPRPSRPEACGLRHLALEVADIDVAVKFIQGKGIAVESIRLDELTGKRYTFFADPDGLPIEFYEC